jgi:GNAT superfamily N-acetyltransferase
VAPHGQLRLQDSPAGAGDTCRTILNALPSWFGIPTSVENYVAVADRSPTVIASLGSREVGLLTLLRRSPYAAELYVMGILPDFHRQGIGQALLQYAEGMLAADGVSFLQVKTLSPRKPDAGYEITRAFYFSCGFRPLEEFPDLWGPDNPALQMIKIVPGSGAP